MESSNNAIKNEHLTINVKKEPGCQVTLDVTVSPTGVKAAYHKAIKNVSKEVSLPGFRQGKAPEALVKQKFSKYVDQELNQIIVNTTIKEALELVRLYPFQKNSITPSLKSLSTEEGAHIIYQFEASPEIPEIDPSGITIKEVSKKDVTEENVDSAIHDIRVHHATWNPITERGVEDGDYVDVTIENLDDHNAILCKDARFEVSPKKMGKWMIEAIKGLKAGESVEKVSEPDELIPSEQFKATNCLIKINQVLQAELLPLDGSLAAKVGLSTYDELRSRIRKELEKNEETYVEEQRHEQLRNQLIERYQIEFPKSLVESETKRYLQSLNAQSYGEDASSLMEKAQQLAINDLTIFYLSVKFSEAHNIKINNDEFVREYVMESYKHMGDPNQHEKQDVEAIRSQVYYRLLFKKVFDDIIHHAKSE